jgi:putative flippase GtrA
MANRAALDVLPGAGVYLPARLEYTMADLAGWLWLRERIPASLTRWILVGAAFEVIGIGLLSLLHDAWQLPLILATALAGEATLLPRFVINNRWVFGFSGASLARLAQYHFSCAGSYIVWFSVSNLLPALGVHYLLASLAGTGCSVGLALMSNFGWVWRKPPTWQSAQSARFSISVAAEAVQDL